MTPTCTSQQAMVLDLRGCWFNGDSSNRYNSAKVSSARARVYTDKVRRHVAWSEQDGASLARSGWINCSTGSDGTWKT